MSREVCKHNKEWDDLCEECEKENGGIEMAHSPSPEARVDWEHEVNKGLSEWLIVPSDSTLESLRRIFTKICQAAFEKGREAR